MLFRSQVTIWGRNARKAAVVVDKLAAQGVSASVATNVQAALAQADIAVAATTATAPFIRTAWVRPGTHLGLVGAFTPTMAEAEPGLMARCQLFADTREGVLQKGGEVVQALAQGLIQPESIVADLGEMLVQPQRRWRRDAEAITVFKSVGFAALDLVAAELVWRGGAAASPSPHS